MLSSAVSRLVIVSIMAMLPTLSHATACGGLDNTWDERSEQLDGYVASVWHALRFGSGEMYDRSYATSQSLQVTRESGGLRLIGEHGTYLFKHNHRLLHRRADITFITHPDTQLSDEADIYHELILEGSFETLSDTRADQTAPRRARLVVQGLGNACLDSEAFKKWLLVVEDSDWVIWGELKAIVPTPPTNMNQ
jgi:hypothetical protein